MDTKLYIFLNMPYNIIAYILCFNLKHHFNFLFLILFKMNILVYFDQWTADLNITAHTERYMHRQVYENIIIAIFMK